MRQFCSITSFSLFLSLCVSLCLFAFFFLLQMKFNDEFLVILLCVSFCRSTAFHFQNIQMSTSMWKRSQYEHFKSLRMAHFAKRKSFIVNIHNDCASLLHSDGKSAHKSAKWRINMKKSNENEIYPKMKTNAIRIEQGNATRKRLRWFPLNHLQQQRYNAIYHSKNAGIINTLIKINKYLSRSGFENHRKYMRWMNFTLAHKFDNKARTSELVYTHTRVHASICPITVWFVCHILHSKNCTHEPLSVSFSAHSFGIFLWLLFLKWPFLSAHSSSSFYRINQINTAVV